MDSGENVSTHADAAALVVDPHCHTLHSDGELIPAEFLRRAEVAGLGGVILTDHGDASNLECVLDALGKACASELEYGSIQCAVGVELTHVRPGAIAELVGRARALGARFVVVHGESPVEPVASGTNRAAIEAGCDMLAHPGLVTEEIATLAAKKNVLLEISGKPGHSLANGHVAAIARACGARVVYGGDCHRPGEIRTPEGIRFVLRCAGLNEVETEAAIQRGREALSRALQSSPGA
jgi:putative hydrolase